MCISTPPDNIILFLSFLSLLMFDVIRFDCGYQFRTVSPRQF